MGETELIARIKTGTKAERDTAFDTLAKLYEQKVKHLCRRFTTPLIPLDDLKQSALMALWFAVGGFDPNRGVKFTTYAEQAIENALLRHHEQLRQPKRCIVRVGLSLDAEDDDGQAIKHALGVDDPDTLEAIDWLARAKPLLLQRLTPQQREYLEAFLHGDNQTQIAERFGYSRQRAQQTQRAIETIAAEVREELDREPQPRSSADDEMPPVPTSAKPGRDRLCGRSLPSTNGKTPPVRCVGNEGDRKCAL